MQKYKRDFIEFMASSGVLNFGSFKLKSGRVSPFYINTGAYVTGAQLHKLGCFYAHAIYENFGLDFDVIFGPAYKGIPLAVVTTMAFDECYNKQLRYCSNRKELKDHGDAGILLGSPLKDGDRVLIVEDVTTSGKSIDESYQILSAAADLELVGLMVSLDRQETAPDGHHAASRLIEQRYALPYASIVTMSEVIEELYNKECHGRVFIDDKIKAACEAYYAKYGAKDSL